MSDESSDPVVRGELDRSPVDPGSLRYDDRGLIPVIVQDAENGEVLMMAWANREALDRTLAEGRMVYWSRSRGSSGARATRAVTCSSGTSCVLTATPM